MVSVSLKDLVVIPGTRPLWPAEFRELVAACEKLVTDPAPAVESGEMADPFAQERGPYGGVADWIQEHAGEPRFEVAWRWLAKRPGVFVSRIRMSPDDDGQWRLVDPPKAFGEVAGPWATGLAGLVATLADRLVQLRSELE